MYAISQKLANAKTATYLRNTRPHLFTFFRYEDMSSHDLSSHDNDIKKEIRDGVTP